MPPACAGEVSSRRFATGLLAPLQLAAMLLAAALLASSSAQAQEPAPNAIEPPLGAAAIDQSAEDAWPGFTLNTTDRGDEHTIVRGPGHYLSLAKIIAAWLLFALWVWTADFVNRDAQTMRLDVPLWNSIMLFPFLAAAILMWLTPHYPLGFVLMLMAYGAPFGAYIWFRNHAVEEHEQILTPDHFRHLMAHKAKRVGVKVSTEKKFAHEQGAPIDFIPQGGATERDNMANLLLARQSPGFVIAKEIIAESIGNRSEVLMLDYSAKEVGVRCQIDGVWHASAPRDRASGDMALAVYKTLAALNPAERGAKQSGRFGASYAGKTYLCRLLSQGTETGERAVIKLDDRASTFHSLLALGMRDKMREQLLEMMNGGPGFLLFAAMPAGGLSTTLKVALEESDRLMRSYAAIEEVSHRELDIENVEVVTYNAAARQTPSSVMAAVQRSFPDVIVSRDLPDEKIVMDLCKEVSEDGRMAIGTIRAKEAPEALLRVLALKVPPQLFAPVAKGVLAQRLVRKLCDACKVPYEPTPEMLAKLGIPAGRIQALYREPNTGDRESGCPSCGGTGFVGRTSIFELLVVDNGVRKALIEQPKLEVVKKFARAAGMRSLQEEGILLVARGITSLSELTRVLKQ